MKKIKPILFIAVFVLPLLLTGITAFAFPGFHSGAECAYCHNEPGYAYWDGYASEAMVLDGVDNEGFWSDAFKRHMTIPVVYRNGSSDLREEFIAMTFAQNTTHLFMYVEIDDTTLNGTNSPKYAPADGFAICWNIDAEVFNASYLDPGYMVTGEGSVDTFIWKPTDDMTGLGYAPDDPYGTNVTCNATGLDYSFDQTGWHDDTQQDYQTAAIFGNISKYGLHGYGLEIVRPLVTGDVNDSQFDHSGLYEFAIAIFNVSSGVYHLTSFLHAVHIYNPSGGGVNTPDEGPNTLLIITIVTSAIAAAAVVVAIIALKRQ